jgi:ketosteroid isomerase-like protein
MWRLWTSVNDRNDGGAPQHSPVSLVLRKEADMWKIASLRVMAPSVVQ